MQINITDKVVASREYTNKVVIAEIENMGYKVHGDLYPNINVTKIEPMRIETLKGGFLFLKTYHKWWWKLVTKVTMECVELGKYKLYIELPDTQEDLFDVKLFLDGVKKRLCDINLEDSIDVIFIKVVEYDEYKTDDIPDYNSNWY